MKTIYSYKQIKPCIIITQNEYLQLANTIVREAAKKALADIQKQKIPGFELIFAIAGLLAVAYILRRKG